MSLCGVPNSYKQTVVFL